MLTDRERQLLDLIRAAPLATSAELARHLGMSRPAVNVHLSNLTRKGALLGRGYVVAPEAARVVVVGGANMDVKTRIVGETLLHTSNPGVTMQSPGGVGRNVAENLARLGIHTELIAAVGRDNNGELLLRETEAAGVITRNVLRLDQPTGTYTAVLNASGELLVAVAAMQATDALTPSALNERRGVLRGASWVVTDGNLQADTLSHLLTICAEHGTSVMFDPVSVPKAKRLLPALQAGLLPHTLTPNLEELEALLGREVGESTAAIAEAAAELLQLGAQVVWVRRGLQGSVLCTPSGPQEFAALPAEVQDVTGAGDSMLGTYLAALLSGYALPEAVPLAHAAAALTVESAHAVAPSLSFGALQARLEAQV